MANMIMQAADELCEGRLVMVHEGGYAEAVVPFCGVAGIEQLSGIKTKVEDPFRVLLETRQPPQVLNDLQLKLLKEQVQCSGV